MGPKELIKLHLYCYSSFKIGEHAAVSHTAISVLGIEGSTCAMDALSTCASITHGTVNILHPLEMVRQIRLISQNPIIATEVELTYLLHPAISIDRPSESQFVTMVRDQLGNATRETDVTLSFTVDTKKLKNVTSLPFQVKTLHHIPSIAQCVLLNVCKLSKEWTERVHHCFIMLLPLPLHLPLPYTPSTHTHTQFVGAGSDPLSS